MKRWHMEGIVSFTGRTSSKLEIPHPGQRTIWSASSAARIRTDSVLVKVLRAAKERMLRQV